MTVDDIPDYLDRLRVFPRAFIVLYGVVFYEVVRWFMFLDDPSNAQAAFTSTIVGAAAGFFGLYLGGGKGKKE